MSKLTVKNRERLKALATRPDKEIDTSGIPEIRRIPAGAVIGKFYRPVMQSVTIRIDADVLDWLKADGGGHQTRINTYLREAMRKNQKAS